MKKLSAIIASLIVIIASGCNDSQNKVAAGRKNEQTSSNVLGFWRYFEDENARIVIERDSVFYPDVFKRYPYKLANGFILITMDAGHIDTIKYQMQGRDSLLFINEGGTQINVRMKDDKNL